MEPRQHPARNPSQRIRANKAEHLTKSDPECEVKQTGLKNVMWRYLNKTEKKKKKSTGMVQQRIYQMNSCQTHFFTHIRELYPSLQWHWIILHLIFIGSQAIFLIASLSSSCPTWKKNILKSWNYFPMFIYYPAYSATTLTEPPNCSGSVLQVRRIAHQDHHYA